MDFPGKGTVELAVVLDVVCVIPRFATTKILGRRYVLTGVPV